MLLCREQLEVERGPPGLSGSAWGACQAADAETPQNALQQTNINTEGMQSALIEKETQLAAALQRAEQLSAELVTANRVAEDRQRLLCEEASSRSILAHQCLQLEQQLKAKQASLDTVQRQLETNGRCEAVQLQKLQGMHTPIESTTSQRPMLDLNPADSEVPS